MAEAARKFEVAETPLYREAPNNIEAEQALLGAILVNNDAFYRVSDFLKPAHFYEPLHRKIFEVAANSSAWARWPSRSRSRPSCRPTRRSAT